ncbi:MAG: Type II secretion system F domain protein [Parcubacteria group bacterium GW2011_GWA2_36_10]|nr:MAG: Type II secretion system F domain protein [Parcubacteria group bacterium GW2011_GWA2_36_10]
MLFIYKIADQAGKITTGQIEASSNNEARARLASQNGTVLNLVEAKARTSITKAEFTFGRVKLIDKMVFAKHLAIMIKAGMPLDEGLETLMVQSSAAMSAKIKVILADV